MSIGIDTVYIKESHSMIAMSHIPSVHFLGSASIHARCGEIGVNITDEWRGRTARTRRHLLAAGSTLLRSLMSQDRDLIFCLSRYNFPFYT